MVTTPSDVSLEDARKAVHMFRQVKVPILGLVENMSYLMPSRRTHGHFRQGGGKRMAEAMDIPFLGELPLDPEVRIGGDTGHPAAPVRREPARRSTPWRKRSRPPWKPAKTGPKITLED